MKILGLSNAWRIVGMVLSAIGAVFSLIGLIGAFGGGRELDPNTFELTSGGPNVGGIITNLIGLALRRGHRAACAQQPGVQPLDRLATSSTPRPRPRGARCAYPPAMGRALLTDLYELNMAASYFRRGMNGTATFSLFIRNLPQGWGFLVACGLEACLDYLEALAFTDEDLEYLRRAHGYSDEVLERFAQLRFTGEVGPYPRGAWCSRRSPSWR